MRLISWARVLFIMRSRFISSSDRSFDYDLKDRFMGIVIWSLSFKCIGGRI
jgi:hypothetical protein